MISVLATNAGPCRAGLWLVLATSLGAARKPQLDLAEADGGAETASSALLSRVLPLNRLTFGGNVLQAGAAEERTPNWLVAFCPSWWEPCQSLAEPYAQLGGSWERRLNTGLLSLEVRFASVDCATDKVLCNEQGVESYPTVHHYHRGKLVASWSGGGRDNVKSLTRWLERQLQPVVGAQPAAASVDGRSPWGALRHCLTPSDPMLDMLLVLAVLGLNFRAVCGNPSIWQKRSYELEQVADKAKQCVADSGAQATGSARLLPPEWAANRHSLEL